MTDSNTVDKITSWASDKYASTPSSTGSMSGSSTSTAAPGSTPAGTSDGLLSAAAATPATTAGTTGGATGGATTSSTGTSSTSSAPSANVSDWYRAALGRDGDAGGISFWQNALNNGADANSLYNDFLSAAGTNHEAVKSGTTFEQANNYSGPTSSDGSTNVDEWGRNVLGRNLTAAETSQWKAALDGAKTPDQAYQVYNDFLTANKGSIRNNLDFSAASQINPVSTAPEQGAVTVSPNQLAVRTVDQPTETVQGQLGTILAADNPVLQQARADGQRTAFDRGLGNSSIAASAGEDALIRAATGIATTDAGTYNNAANYNVAADNQAIMYNVEQQNEFNKLKLQYGDAEASRIMQQQIAQMQNDTTKAGQAQQMTLAQMQDATTRWNTEQNTANSRYNTDSAYKQQVDNQKLGVANNIIQNMDLSPDRKAAMLEQLGFGTMAKPGVPGTGLAGAVYVIDSTGGDLNFGADRAQQAVNGVMSALG